MQFLACKADNSLKNLWHIYDRCDQLVLRTKAYTSAQNAGIRVVNENHSDCSTDQLKIIVTFIFFAGVLYGKVEESKILLEVKEKLNQCFAAFGTFYIHLGHIWKSQVQNTPTRQKLTWHNLLGWRLLVLVRNI